MALPDKKDKINSIVEESLKTRKARDKLKKRFEMMDAKITKEALKQKTIEIHRWISRHADCRITLRDKAISLFDENENASVISQKISAIVEKLKEDKS